MRKLLVGLASAVLVASASFASAAESKPTIVLVHGAFADGSSWNGVIGRLEKDGYSVVAVANPLRSVKSDADYVRRIVTGLKTDVVLVGHSYGGSVISEAADQTPNVRSLVYVAAFAPDVGESAGGLSGKFPGSTLGPTLAPPVELPGGGKDLYIQQDKFHDQFAADVSKTDAKLMAAAQRPVTEAALTEVATAAAWKKIPSWSVYGDADKNIPPQALAWMAERAHSKDTVVVKGASHVVMLSHPDTVAKVIEEAAATSR
ncbi:alpha/beta fold hydrolase [Phyllobacterium endophyticum]|uniref:Alpha/beta hydrolase n=1 Tax=Phyllobacterium endophyticum TaxID=1149773 RepID=A0A2P7AMP9_9HYPH|nr:alpha/beta hydrolase [Phyllobacterium endophyticum]MBB3238293.1 pimeloyl-ACP methyl ester carboxylesterase [Phyllobacterium endophyticum]PSH55470.1 alpha/beta hydrolase [Phyllobacterium endophyticum]TYR40204.1 alpha/beta hydrolase [Phyllobacterium endophyticum]